LSSCGVVARRRGGAVECLLLSYGAHGQRWVRMRRECMRDCWRKRARSTLLLLLLLLLSLKEPVMLILLRGEELLHLLLV